MRDLDFLDVHVNGRPAPQGSKKRGAAGQMLESSSGLVAWRARVKEAVYLRYRELGIMPSDTRGRPVFVGPVTFGATFWMPPGRRIDASPDLDKLCRAVWDSLTDARVWEDDGRVVEIEWLSKLTAEDLPGCDLIVRPAKIEETRWG